MQIDHITRTDELEALRPEWEGLWQRCPAAGPFQHPDWVIAWWRHVGGGELSTVAFRDGGEMVGLAPLYLHIDVARGLRQLTLLGNGVSDTLDVLIAPDAPAAAAALCDVVAGHGNGWNALDLRDLPARSPLLAAARPGGPSCEPDVPRFDIDLRAAGPDLAGLTSPKLRGNLRRARRHAERHGGVSVQRAGSSDLQAALDELFALHGARWRERGEDGVLTAPAIQAFHREVAGRFAARGWLRHYALRIGGRTVAANYGFCLRRRSYYYIGGFDPALEACSPGALVLQHALREAVAEGAVLFDLLRGREGYKSRWGAVDRPQFRLRGMGTESGVADR